MLSIISPQTSAKLVGGYGTALDHVLAMAFDDPSIDDDLRRVLDTHEVVLDGEWLDIWQGGRDAWGDRSAASVIRLQRRRRLASVRGSRHEWHCRECNVFHGKGKGSRAMAGAGRMVCCEGKGRTRFGDNEAPPCARRCPVGVRAQHERLPGCDVSQANGMRA